MHLTTLMAQRPLTHLVLPGPVTLRAYDASSLAPGLILLAVVFIVLIMQRQRRSQSHRTKVYKTARIIR